MKIHSPKNILVLVLFALPLFAFSQNLKTPGQKLDSMGIKLPPPTTPVANFVKWVKSGDLVYTSGHGPSRENAPSITGKVGLDLTVEEGYAAARLTGIALLSTLKDACGGDLGRVKRIVKVLGMVNCPTDFTQQSAVMNGFSDLMVAVFGDKGKHARSAVGMGSLPGNMAVEIEMIVEVE